ncbi:hypothetical protein D9Q98_004403 [Chlorella vulgaris]|uniref:Uncharacterized protein n=1 Tax=Chlorella vulgaris TaxID=3077 RepID=A0A9D4TPJ9_CHLVU|nr:hypothetical protein D9Q98_004403 [Chlorella vulgaris]
MGREARPVVLLLGWLGSKEQYVKKYRALWEGLGAQVFQHQPSILQTALPGVADRALLRLMSDISSRYSTLRATSGEAPPVLVHAMSNAGFVAFGTMLHLTSLANPAALPRGAPGSPAASLKPQLQTDWKSAPGAGGGAGPSQDGWQAGSPRQAATRSGEDGESSGGLCVSGSGSQGDVLSGFKQVLHHTQGIVLDSAPSQATAHIWSRGVLAAVLAQPVQEVEESHPMLLRNLHSLAERYFMLPQVARRMREVRHAWQHHVPPCPQLYLYSKSDALIPYQHIELFMEQQEAHGVCVHHHRWDDTAHCEHMRKHPEQYRSLVRSFSEHCLHGQGPPKNWI